MVASARPRLRGALPPALLALALASLFVFGHDRSQFYRPSIHDYVSAETLSLAANFSAEHRFAGVLRWKLDEDGEPRYVVYNRHPAGPTVLVKLAILPFGDDIPRQIGAARLLMLACFAAAAALAYLALARLLADRWIALAAALFACSSYYCLHYADMISAVAPTSLLGVMLTFHGMAVFAQEGRFRQLLAKTAAGLLLGWHAAGLAAAFAALGLAGELLRATADGAARAPAPPSAVARSRYLAFGAFAALCCALLLGFNLGAEYLALRGEVPLHELPTVRSVLSRAGADAAYTGGFGWPAFLRGQLGGVGGMAIPFVLADGLGLAQPHHGLWPPPDAAPRFAAAGAAAAAACFAGLRWLPRRLLFASLLLGGWAWAIPFRGTTALHEFEAILHFGFPLALGALALPVLRRAIGRERAARAAPALAVAALALFVLSAWRMGGAGHDAEAARVQREMTADFRAIRGIAAGGGVLYDAMLRASVPAHGRAVRGGWWLAGSRVSLDPLGSEQEWARASRRDFVAVFADLGGSLTPENRRVFLYGASSLPGVYDAIAAREPALRSRFDLRLGGRALILTRDGCSADDAARPFRLEIVPVDAADLPAAARAAGFEAAGFGLHDAGLRFGGRCVARIALPDYPVAGVRASQRIGGLPPLWEASIPVADPAFPRLAAGWRDAFAGREPAVRAAFDVHLDGRTLTYVRDGCGEADTAARFFLHAVPLDAGDLPAERREAGFGNLDFAFADRGLRLEGRCVASAELPDYGVARVRTGQFAGGERLWEAEFAIPAGE